MLKLFLLSFLMINILSTQAQQTISPYQYGLREACSGIERYRVLYRVHKAAIEKGLDVSYIGIDSIEIEIPQDARPIPLGESTDFCNMVLSVIDNSKDAFVFQMAQKTDTIIIEKNQVDSGDFANIDNLKIGYYILVLQDDNPWVEKRRGHDYGHLRKDILFVKDGKAKNKPISPYNNKETSVSATYCKVTPSKKVIKNLKMVRSIGNKKKAFLFDIRHQYNVDIRNIEVYTPKCDTLVDDRLIRVYNSVCISFRNVLIDGTYSQKKHSGYGLAFNNVYNSKFYSLMAHGNWGVYGTNNMNTVLLDHCDINRFDIHCYGKDIFFNKCTFRNIANYFSSVYGKIIIKKCNFIDFIPVILRNDYNAHPKFDLEIYNCVFNSPLYDYCYLIKAMGLYDLELNKRSELQMIRIPNILIHGLKINSRGNKQRIFNLFDIGTQYNNKDVFTKRLDKIQFFPDKNVKFIF